MIGDTAFGFITEVPKHDELIDLIDLGYFFAIEKIPEHKGTIKLETVHWSQETESFTSEQIPLIDCNKTDNLNPKLI